MHPITFSDAFDKHVFALSACLWNPAPLANPMTFRHDTLLVARAVKMSI
jgi:hypothetical protein